MGAVTDAIKSVVKDVGDAVSGIAHDITGAIKDSPIGKAVDFLTGGEPGLASNICNSVDKSVGQVAQGAEKLADGVCDGNAGEALAGAGEAAWGGFKIARDVSAPEMMVAEQGVKTAAQDVAT